jgi:hypothetical protein
VVQAGLEFLEHLTGEHFKALSGLIVLVDSFLGREPMTGM